AKEPQARFASAAELLESLGLEAEGVDEGGLLGSPVLGREQVQEVLAARAAGTVWLVGGPGAGKSRLLSEARAESQLAGVKTLFAQGLGLEAPPYEAIKPWLRAIAAPGAPAFDRLAPVIARVLPEIGVAPAAALEGMQERVRLHAAVRELASALAEAVFYLDDADAIDASSQELLQFLARQDDRAWQFVLTGQAAPEGAEALALSPLTEALTCELARALLGQDHLPEAVTERLPVLTGGMPGAIEAVLGHWLRTGALKREGGAWVAGASEAFELPGGLSVVLDSRFTALSAEAQAVGRAASILGATGDLRMLQSLVDMPEGSFFAALSELEGAEVLLKDGQAFRFARPAQAQALAAAWEPEAARAMHGRAADWLTARLGPEAADPAHPLGEVMAAARHLLEGPEPGRAVRYVEAAVRRSLSLYAVGQSESLLRRVLAVSGIGEADRLRLSGLLANVLRYQGQIDEALALYEETILPGVKAAEAPELASELVTYGILQQLKGQYPQALEAFATAINRADETKDVATGVRARLYAGRVAYFSGETGAAKTHLASGVRRADEAGLTALLAGGLSLYGYVLATTEPGKMAEGLAALDRAIKLNQDLGDLGEAVEALNNRGNLLLAAGRLGEAQAAFEECLAICEKMAAPNETIFAHLNLGAVCLEQGGLETARSHGRKAAEMSRKQGRKFPEGFSLALEGVASVYRGEFATGVERLARGLALSREIANKYLELNVLVYWVEALVFLGRWAEAEEGLAKARALAEATSSDEHNAKFDRLEAAMGVARGSDQAGAALAAQADSAREKAQPVALAHALRWRAEWLLARGAAAAASGLLSEATAVAGEAGLKALLAELALLQGVIAARGENLAVA
ncbi:MAG: ATP-binding protein, partial [Candidatus Sericytochromatia bacterium]